MTRTSARGAPLHPRPLRDEARSLRGRSARERRAAPRARDRASDPARPRARWRGRVPREHRSLASPCFVHAIRRRRNPSGRRAPSAPANAPTPTPHDHPRADGHPARHDRTTGRQRRAHHRPSSGIGEATARELAWRGATVAIAARRIDTPDALPEDIAAGRRDGACDPGRRHRPGAGTGTCQARRRQPRAPGHRGQQRRRHAARADRERAHGDSDRMLDLNLKGPGLRRPHRAAAPSAGRRAEAAAGRRHPRSPTSSASSPRTSPTRSPTSSAGRGEQPSTSC
jgi:hypothetical protein